MEWLTHTASALAGALTVLLPVGFWAWRQKNSIQSQQARDAYEFDKIRRSDAYKELSAIVAELKADAQRQDQKLDAQNKRIEELNTENIACARKSAMQDVEIYKQAGIITFLEARVKSLEASILPPVVTPAASGQGVILAQAVKDVAKEAIAEASPAQTGN